MGRVVLAANVTAAAAGGVAPTVRAYAHCHPARRGHVGLVLLNVGAAPQTVALPPAPPGAWRDEYHLTAGTALDGQTVRLNGAELRLRPGGLLPPLTPVAVAAADAPDVTLAAQSIAFLVLPPGPGLGGCAQY